MINSKEPITNYVVWELKADITFLNTETSVIGEPDMADYQRLFGTFDTEKDALTALKRFNPVEHAFNYVHSIGTMSVYIVPKIVCTTKERVLTHITDSYDSYLPSLKRRINDLEYSISTLKRILDKDGNTISMFDSRRASKLKSLNTKQKHLDRLNTELDHIQTLVNTNGNEFYTEL